METPEHSVYDDLLTVLSPPDARDGAGDGVLDASLDTTISGPGSGPDGDRQPAVASPVRVPSHPAVTSYAVRTPRHHLREVPRPAARPASQPSPAPQTGQATDGDVDELATKLDDFAEVLKRGVLERYMRAKREQLRAGAEEASAIQERHEALLRAKEAECESLREEGSALVLRARVMDTALGCARRAWARDRHHTRDLFSGERSALRVFGAWRGFASARRRRRVAEARVAARTSMLLQRRLFNEWRLLAQRGHQSAVDAFWQAKVREGVQAVTDRYSGRVQGLREELAEREAELSRALAAQRDLEANVRRLFLRGVSAMSLEASSLFAENGIVLPASAGSEGGEGAADAGGAGSGGR